MKDTEAQLRQEMAELRKEKRKMLRNQAEDMPQSSAQPTLPTIPVSTPPSSPLQMLQPPLSAHSEHPSKVAMARLQSTLDQVLSRLDRLEKGQVAPSTAPEPGTSIQSGQAPTLAPPNPETPVNSQTPPNQTHPTTPSPATQVQEEW